MTTFSSEEITLDYHHFLKFTGWKSSTYKKRTTRARISKLKNMGACDIQVTGTGTEAMYFIKLAPMFWPVFLASCRGIQYDEVAAAYLHKLFSGGTTEETSHGRIALFSDELYQDITSYLNNHDHNSSYTYLGVKTKCDRIRTEFKKVGYFAPKDSRLIKTHRVKENEDWLRGHRAYTASENVLDKWREFFKDLEKRYFETFTESNVVPPKIKGKAAKDFQLKQLPFDLGIQHSQPCIEKRLDEVFFEDLRFAQYRFQQTNNLQLVKNAVIERQNRRHEEIERQHEENKRHKENQTAHEDQPISNLNDTDINSLIAKLYTDPSSVNTDYISDAAFRDMLDDIPFGE